MAQVKFAVVDVGDYLSKKQASGGKLAADWAKLEELYNKKLWHQLTLKLLEFVKVPELQKGDNLIQLYNNFLTVFEGKINPLSLVEICVFIVQQYENKRDAITFLEKIEGKIKSSDLALTLCKVLQGQLYLDHLKDLDATKKIIEELAVSLDDADGVTPVHGRYYHLASNYYRIRGPLSQYYRCTLRYVGCEDGGAKLPLSQRRECAFRLAIAAMLADDVYNLPELLAHPIIECLDGTDQAWAGACVRALAHGDIAAWEALRPKWSSVPDLARAEAQLRQKISMLCLSEMAFSRGSAQRKLTFAEIAQEARLPINEVELLVMKALAKKLIRGAIDQVSETVRVTWVRPRALTSAQVANMAAKLDVWCLSVHSAAGMLENAASDVLTL